MKDEDVEKFIRSNAQSAVVDIIRKVINFSEEEGFSEGLVTRYREGRAQFGGEFDPASEDWEKHREQELQDAVIYSSFKWLKTLKEAR